MTFEEKLMVLKTKVDASDVSDDVLSAYLISAGHAILNRKYPFGWDEEQTVPHQFDMLQCDIAAYLMNKSGADGQIIHNENGVLRHYENGGIPESMLSQVTPMGVVF